MPKDVHQISNHSEVAIVDFVANLSPSLLRLWKSVMHMVSLKTEFKIFRFLYSACFYLPFYSLIHSLYEHTSPASNGTNQVGLLC